MNVIAGWMIAVALFVGLGQVAEAIEKQKCGSASAAKDGK